MGPVSRTSISRKWSEKVPNRIEIRLAHAVYALALAWTMCVVSALAQAPATGSNWDRLKALPTATKLYVSGDKGGATCKLVSVDDASLVCSKHTFARADVKSVKLTRYGMSYGAGALIGAGVGAGIGLGVSTATDDSFFKNDKASFVGGFAVLGAVVGTLVTGPLDLFKGPTVYRR